VTQLVEEVQSGVERTPDGGMMSLAFAVVLAASDVYSGGPVEAGDAVPGVEVEPEVTHLQGHQF
jgi:hypothetical protein